MEKPWSGREAGCKVAGFAGSRAPGRSAACGQCTLPTQTPRACAGFPHLAGPSWPWAQGSCGAKGRWEARVRRAWDKRGSGPGPSQLGTHVPAPGWLPHRSGASFCWLQPGAAQPSWGHLSPLTAQGPLPADTAATLHIQAARPSCCPLLCGQGGRSLHSDPSQHPCPVLPGLGSSILDCQEASSPSDPLPLPGPPIAQ